MIELFDFFPNNFLKYFFGLMKFNNKNHLIFENAIQTFFNQEHNSSLSNIKSKIHECIRFYQKDRISLTELLHSISGLIIKQNSPSLKNSNINVKDLIKKINYNTEDLSHDFQNINNFNNQKEIQENKNQGYYIFLKQVDIYEKKFNSNFFVHQLYVFFLKNINNEVKDLNIQNLFIPVKTFKNKAIIMNWKIHLLKDDEIPLNILSKFLYFLYIFKSLNDKNVKSLNIHNIIIDCDYFKEFSKPDLNINFINENAISPHTFWTEIKLKKFNCCFPSKFLVDFFYNHEEININEIPEIEVIKNELYPHEQFILSNIQSNSDLKQIYFVAKLLSSIYEECFEEDRFGFVLLETGETYIGLFKNQLFNGLGFFYNSLSESNNIISYFGNFVNGVRDGIGIEFLENEIYLKAKWQNQNIILNSNILIETIFNKEELNSISNNWLTLTSKSLKLILIYYVNIKKRTITSSFFYNIDPIDMLLNNYSKFIFDDGCIVKPSNSFANQICISKNLNIHLLQAFNMQNIYNFNHKYEGYISDLNFNREAILIFLSVFSSFFKPYEKNFQNNLEGNCVVIYKELGIFKGYIRISENKLIVRDGWGIMVHFNGHVKEGIWKNNEFISEYIVKAKIKKIINHQIYKTKQKIKGESKLFLEARSKGDFKNGDNWRQRPENSDRPSNNFETENKGIKTMKNEYQISLESPTSQVNKSKGNEEEYTILLKFLNTKIDLISNLVTDKLRENLLKEIQKARNLHKINLIKSLESILEKHRQRIRIILAEALPLNGEFENVHRIYQDFRDLIERLVYSHYNELQACLREEIEQILYLNETSSQVNKTGVDKITNFKNDIQNAYLNLF